MLKTMRRIVQEVNAAETLSDALNTMARMVREALETQACSIFLMDKTENALVLMATEGLNPALIGVRVPTEAGLIGLVITRGEPINLDDAPSHPNFHILEGFGEERFHAMLAVPIIYQRRALGVIMVEQEESRRFDEGEEAFLITMSAQLAGVIAHAEASGKLPGHASSKEASQEVQYIEGIGSVPGIGIGQAVAVYPLADLTAVPDKQSEDPTFEKEKFHAAVLAARQDIESLCERMRGTLPEQELALFDVYLKILESQSLIDEILSEIDKGKWAEGALSHVIRSHIQQFEAMDDPYLRERAADIRDLGRRVLFYLQEDKRKLPNYPENTILIGDEVTAAALAEVPEGYLKGVVSAKGSSNSHVAILARAMGVPTVMGVHSGPIGQYEGAHVVVNGYHGRVYISPPPSLLKEFTTLAEEERQLDEDLEKLRGLPAETLDGFQIHLYVNTGLAADVDRSLRVGAEGVGLYRTEVPFMTRDRFPSEEEQRIIYRQLLGVFKPHPVTMRTLDVGGDKILPYFPIDEENPFLGWRGIRITLDHPDIFLVQARAMLRASEGLNNLQVMFPMITSVTEADEAMRLFQQAYHELCEEGLELVMPKMGVMIEVPSAAMQADALSQRFDFLSVGSNDLTQYMLAVDRNNTRVASLYNPLHPAVINALKMIVDAAHRAGKQVSICGEMAGDPASVILLLAMGFDSLSMSASGLPRAKWVIRNFKQSRAQQLLQEVLTIEDPAKIRSHLEQALLDAGLGGLIWAGK